MSYGNPNPEQSDQQPGDQDPTLTPDTPEVPDQGDSPDEQPAELPDSGKRR